MGVGTKNELYKVKDTGLMAAPHTNTIGVGMKEIIYRECGIGEGNVLENNREI